MEALNEQTAQMVASTYGDDYSFEIKEISYTKVEDGYISLITYQLEDGTIGNYGITNSNETISLFKYTVVQKTVKIVNCKLW